MTTAQAATVVGSRVTLAQHLARFVYETKEVPPSARAMAANAVLDLMSAALVGHDSPGGRSARQGACSIFGGGRATVWFSHRRLTVSGAAFANAAAASMLDLDDGHRAAAGHPGASIIPAVLATAEAHGASAGRILTAIALGYEIAIRIAAARDFERLETLVTGPWCGQGAAAAAAWLRGLTPDAIAQAIAIAGSSAPNLAAVAYSRVMGNHVKEGIAWATATGLSAVDLATAGFTGPLDLLDNRRLYDVEALLGGLGDSWLIETIYFKPYSCCRWAHAAIDALLALQAEHQIVPNEIQCIRVWTFARALSLNNDRAPDSLEAAQYSLPFCIALAALRGSGALLPLTHDWLDDTAVLALARRVHLEIDPDLDAMFSKAVPARLEITTKQRRFLRTVLMPKGEAANPMTRDDLEKKFATATRDLVDREVSASLLAALTRLEEGDERPLQALLARPLHLAALRQVHGLAMQAE